MESGCGKNRFFLLNTPARVFVNLILSIGYSQSTTLVIELYTSVITQLSRSRTPFLAPVFARILWISARWWWVSSSTSSICTICCGIIHVLPRYLSWRIQPISSSHSSCWFLCYRPNTLAPRLHLVYIRHYSRGSYSCS